MASFEPEQDIIDSVYSNRSGETVKCEKKLKDRGKTRIIIMVNSYSFCLHLLIYCGFFDQALNPIINQASEGCSRKFSSSDSETLLYIDFIFYIHRK